MMYIFDSRERKNEHIKEYFKKNGIHFCVKKLDVGDYMKEGCDVSIDRKQNLSELATNLLGRADKGRFWREVRRSREAGIRLIVLCEHGENVNSIKDVYSWKSEYSNATGRALMDAIYRCSVSYGVEFLFCDKRKSAEKIKELLDRQEAIK